MERREVQRFNSEQKSYVSAINSQPHNRKPWVPFCYHSGSACCLFLVLFFACDSISGFTGSHWTQPQTCLCCTVRTLVGVKGFLSGTPSVRSCPPREDTPLFLRIAPPEAELGLRGRAEVVP